MTDEELIARWDDYVESMGSVMGEVEHMAQQMRDRIEQLVATNEALVKERDRYLRHLTAGAESLRRFEARAERLEAALRELIDHTHNCEKELTERLYRADFCGESLPLTNARAALKG